MEQEKNYFETLNNLDVSDRVEPKGKLKYLSWVWAWGELKKRHPDATYTVYENAHGWNYHTDGKTAWVKTGVTVNGIEHIEYLPVMNNYNKSIELEKITSFDVNTAIQRSITKAIARHGLGLYVYAGEDLPEASKETEGEIIGDHEKELLRQMTESKGYTVEQIFPKGIDLTAAQYREAMLKLEKLKNKDAT